MLLRSGVGRLRLVDFDLVTLSSLNRHAVAKREDVGTPKATCLKKHMLQIMPEVTPVGLRVRCGTGGGRAPAHWGRAHLGVGLDWRSTGSSAQTMQTGWACPSRRRAMALAQQGDGRQSVWLARRGVAGAARLPGWAHQRLATRDGVPGHQTRKERETLHAGA